jgi:hypothetical protein
MAGSDLDTLSAFRAAVYTCFGRRRDALFDLLDALLTSGPCPSVAHLSLVPAHRRGWGSLYAALRHGQVDARALRTLLLRQPEPPGPPVYGVDTSIWPRRDAATSPERGFHYFPAGHHRRPVVEGWAYQWVCRLSPERDSWTAPVDVRRVRPTEKTTLVAVEQVKALVAQRAATERPGAVPLFVFDAWYDAAHFTQALADVPVALVIRLRSNRCFFAEPDPGTQPTRGRRKRHGAKFVCNDPATWPAPTAELRTEDEAYGAVVVRAWAGLHATVRRPARRGHVGGPYRGPRRHARGTIVRLQVERLPSRRRTPAVLWLWWQRPSGQGIPQPEDLDLLWRAYVRRYDLEQTFRFLKQTLHWVRPHVRLPEQADRWTWLVALAYTQLRLARGAVADQRLPWERPLPPPRLTPTRVQRRFVTLAGRLRTPAAPPRPCGRSPGRPKGRRSRPAARHPPVHKAA